jgi:sporulation protein YlmC with PRC-barrel domain
MKQSRLFSNHITQYKHMKRNLKIMLSAATASLLTLAAQPQEAVNPPTVDPGTALARMAPERVELLRSTAKVREVIGLTVENDQHVRLGRVNDFALDLKSGRIVQVIIGSGGAFTAVPPGALHPEDDNGTLRLNVSLEKFKAAPKFDAAKWAEGTQSNRVSEIYAYFGEQPYFATVPVGDATTNDNGTITALGTRTLDHVREQELLRQNNDPNNTISIHNPDGTTSRNYYSDNHAAIGAWSVLGYDQSARKLLGMSLRNVQEIKLGRVENIIVDLKAGRIAAVIIRSGRFFWTGGTLHAVPPTELQLNETGETLQLAVSRSEFAHSPDFNETQWPNYPLPGYAAGSYYPYRIEPYNNNMAP